MTRDRLQELKLFMRDDGFEDYNDESEKDKQTSLIVFCHDVKQVKQEVANLRIRVNDLKCVLNDNQQWFNDENRKELERKIGEEKLIIGNSAKAIRNNLKAMKTASSGEKQKSVILRIKEVQLNALLNELDEILRDYLNCLLRQKERSMRIFQDMMKVKGNDVEDIDVLLEEGKLSIFTNNLLMYDREEKCGLREAESKRDEILQIESSILEVRNLFNELALIVDLHEEKVEQMVKLVDDNLATVESGKKKIVAASEKKRKVRYRKIIIAVVCMSVVVFVVLALTVY